VLEFEWDEAKARANERKHGVSFERAKQAFTDPLAIVLLDDREDYGEERFVLIGLGGTSILFVAYTERGDRVRIISARRATRHEQEAYQEQRDD
jgi:hypothetical protein